jgi:hypothetical protein
MKSSTGPLSTRFPRIDGHTKSISSPILFLAGFKFLGIDFLLLCVTRGTVTSGTFEANFQRVYASRSLLCWF